MLRTLTLLFSEDARNCRFLELATGVSWSASLCGKDTRYVATTSSPEADEVIAKVLNKRIFGSEDMPVQSGFYSAKFGPSLNLITVWKNCLTYNGVPESTKAANIIRLRQEVDAATRHLKAQTPVGSSMASRPA